MAKYEPGQSGNPAGRPKGSKNKVQGAVKGLVESLVIDNSQRIKAAFEKLEGRDLVRALSDLLPYIVPKLQSVSGEIKWEDLTEEQLDEIIQRLKNDING